MSDEIISLEEALSRDEFNARVKLDRPVGEILLYGCAARYLPADDGTYTMEVVPDEVAKMLGAGERVSAKCIKKFDPIRQEWYCTEVSCTNNCTATSGSFFTCKCP